MYDLGFNVFLKSVTVLKWKKKSKSAKELSVFFMDSVKYTVLYVMCVILPAAALAFRSIWELKDELHSLQKYIPFCGILSCNWSIVIILWKC